MKTAFPFCDGRYILEFGVAVIWRSLVLAAFQCKIALAHLPKNGNGHTLPEQILVKLDELCLLVLHDRFEHSAEPVRLVPVCELEPALV